MDNSQNIKTEITKGSSNPSSGCLCKSSENTCLEMISALPCSLDYIIYRFQGIETTQVSSMDEWIKECLHTHTHTLTGILFSHKEEENPIICDNVGGP